MEMSPAEIIDRYVILKLKMESVDDYLSPRLIAKEKPLLQKEFDLYSRTVNELKKRDVGLKDGIIKKLYRVNYKCKERESNVRRNINKISNLTTRQLEEVGKNVIEIRQLNAERIALKNSISKKYKTPTKTLKMSLGEVIDRYTIIKLKTERTNGLTPDQILYEKPNLERELGLYKKAIDEYRKEGIKVNNKWITGLYKINARCWDIEADIRLGKDKKLGLEKIGKVAMVLRRFAQKRIDLKNEIALKSGTGFKEVKIYFK